MAVTARCWVHALRNAMSRCPKRLEAPFSIMVKKIMYASSRDEAQNAFSELKNQMGPDGRRAVETIEKDLEALLAHYSFDKRYWQTLKTTNPIERINKELKRRTKSMDSIGERSLLAVQAFTALKIELGWRIVAVDDKRHQELKHQYDHVERAIDNFLH
jgi:putative transposase